MKVKFTLFITLLFLVSFFASAQVGYKISTEKRLLNGIDSTVFVLEVNRALESDVKKAWDKFVKKNGKAKPTVKNDLITVTGLTISSIDNDPLNIYVSIIQQDTSVKLYSTFIVDSVRVDPHGREGASVKVRKMLGNFGRKVYEQVLERELKDQNEKLESLIKSRDKNLKLQDNIAKSIGRDSLKIGNTETEIKLQKGQLEGAIERYTVQKNKMATLKNADKEQVKAEKSKLKELEKERKSIEKGIVKESEKVVDLKADIRDYWFQLNQLKEDLAKIESDITVQRSNVQEAQNALKTH